MEEVNLTIPGYLASPTEEEQSKIENMLFKFGNARRRAYNMIQRRIKKSEIDERLQRETGLNARYARDAINSIKDLPSNVTFGGKKNQELREKGKISKEKYHRCRNTILISRGEKSKNGNLNTRIVNDDDLKLRINVGDREWIFPNFHIPEKYLEEYGHLLDGSRAYQITIVRKNCYSQDYEVKITITIEKELGEKDHVMALDVNSGHVDWAIVNKGDGRLVDVGKLNCHEVLDASSNKTDNLLHELVNKIRNIAEHYNAGVIVGRLNSGKFSSWNPRANRRVKQMPQYKFRQILKYKLPLRGIPVSECSEAYTTQLGLHISKPLGIDIHKAAAYAFAIKFLNREEFQILRSVLVDEGDGSPDQRLSEGSGPTAFIQSYAQGNLKLSGLDDDDLEALDSSKAIPRPPGRGSPILGLKEPSHTDVKVC